MTDLHDYNQKLTILNFINNTIITLTDSISFLTGQLLTAWSTRTIRQRVKALQNASDILLGNPSKIFGD